MCGRYTLSTPGEELAEVFDLAASPELEARFNIAPTQTVPIVRRDNGDRRAVPCRWGLVPYWAEDPSIGSRMINARAETVDTRRAYSRSFERRRCLVPADGFYEWRRSGSHKQPFFFSRPSGEVFAMAGLWDRWRHGDEPLESFTVVTADANREVAPIHDRMPVVLPADGWETWLDPERGGDDAVRALLRPAPDGLLVARPVSTYVNSPSNDSPRCVEAISAEEAESGPQKRLF